MKAQSFEMQVARRLGTTSFATCWLVTRLDGEVFAFTSHDENLKVDGRWYLASSGFTPSAIATSRGLAVNNLDVVGVLDSLSITEADLEAGRWDGAEVEIFEVNHRDLSMGKMILNYGKLGNVSAGKLGFNAELRGLSQVLQESIGPIYTPGCDADFCDARCGLNEADYTFSATVTSVDPNQNARSFGAAALTQAADYFGAGYVRWTSGDNVGLKMEVRSFASAAVVLALPMPRPIRNGDTFDAVGGCRKTPEPCKTKWLVNNYANFRGFPDVPMNDEVLGTAGIES